MLLIHVLHALVLIASFIVVIDTLHEVILQLQPTKVVELDMLEIVIARHDQRQALIELRALQQIYIIMYVKHHDQADM